MLNLLIDIKKLKALLISLLICAICLALIPTANAIMTAADVKSVRLPILMYHHVLQNKSKLNKYTISPSEFEGDLNYIKNNGYTTITVKNLIDYCENGAKLPDKPIMITFDDGYESVYRFACPLLEKYKMKAVVNVIGKYADLYSECDDHNINYSHITWEQLKEASKSGLLEVQNHTYDMHKNSKRSGIAKMGGESNEHYRNEVLGDIMKMQQRTAEMLNEKPVAFAYPFGKISKEALPIIKEAGIKTVFCCWERVNYLTGKSEELYHLNRFNRPHGISSDSFFESIEKQ